MQKQVIKYQREHLFCERPEVSDIHKKIYAAIDLKSFYASVECVERNLDPLTTNLVVADISRTEKTICLAVTPSLKAYGISGRARLFEVVQKVKEINNKRLRYLGWSNFLGKSYNSKELGFNAALELDYIIAPPRMALYIEYSARIYEVYLKYVAPEDIHVYSIDEVFMDITPYLKSSGLTPRGFVKRIIKDVLDTTGITAAAGLGTNLYLCKVAMDIMAKHVEADEDGVRIAALDEMKYRQKLWNHRPLTDFWRIGNGYARKLEQNGLYTMGDIAQCSIGGSKNYFYNEELLYKLFGVNAELLIDHAWGWEPCTIADIKAYKPENNSIGAGQVLHNPYDIDKAKLVMKEMADSLALDLLDKGLVTDQVVITVSYDRENLSDPDRIKNYKGAIKTDHYGRKVPVHSHGTQNLERYTSSAMLIIDAAMELFDRITDKNLLIRRLNIVANHVIYENESTGKAHYEQMDLFTDYKAEADREQRLYIELNRERKMREAILTVKKKHGKNAILKGMSLEDGATAKDRNEQIGGHKA